MHRRRLPLVLMLVLAPLLTLACGETRRPLGDECIRSDDCLSDTCTARVCVPAPTLATGAQSPPLDDTPRIPSADAADAAPRDAGDGG
jgi:hypothetical protein